MLKFLSINQSPSVKKWSNPFSTFSFPLILLFLSSLFISLLSFGQAIAPGTAPVINPKGGLRVEGNLRANIPSTPLHGDWLPRTATSSLDSSVLTAAGNPKDPDSTYHILDLFTSGDNTFNGGLKKNTPLYNYRWQFANPSPAKCDINHLLMHMAQDPSGDIWISIAGDRESVNGNSFISIALHQKKVVIDSSILNNKGQITGGKFISDADSATGGRTVGDVQISAEFTGGGVNPNLYFEEWRLIDGVYKWDTFLIAPMPAFGSTNAAVINDLPYTVFGGTSYDINSFIEVTFNISEIYRNTSTPCVGSIATMFVQTKSSQSETADLTDFVVPLQINLDINVGPPDADGATYCVGQTINNLTVTGETGATFRWYADEDLDTLLHTGASFATGVDNTKDSVYDYYVTQSIRGCESQATEVILTVNPNATASAGTAPAAQCEDETNGNTFALSGSGSNGTPLWSVQTNANNLGVDFSDSTSFTTNVTITGGSGSVTFLLTVTSNTTPACSSATSTVTVVVNPNPTADAGTAPDAQCYDANGNTFSLSGSGTNGDPSWAVVSNPNNLTVDLTGETTYTPSVSVSGSSNGGTVTLRLTVTSDQDPSCGTDTSDVTVTVNAQAAGPQDEYVGPATCTETTYKVRINNPQTGTYTLTQPGETPKVIEYPNNEDTVVFTDLIIGLGYSVIFETEEGCVSAPSECGIEEANLVTQAPKQQLDQTVITENKPAGTLVTTGRIPVTELQVKAFPNPYNTAINFQLVSPVSGKATLEVYDLMGRRLAVVYQGNLEAGMQKSINYNIPATQRVPMIYKLSVGESSSRGKLMPGSSQEP